MNNVVIFTILVALLVSFVAFPMASGNNGLGKGYEIGKGHENDSGLGHEKHGCNPDCPLCDGYPCVPPCPGV